MQRGIAATLINLYIRSSDTSAVRPLLHVEVHYKCDGRLAGQRTSRPLKAIVTELQFIDDAATVMIVYSY